MSFLQLTIYLDETDTHGEVPLYEAVVRRMLQLNLSGATVQRGVMGYGRHGRVHRSRLFGVSDDRPVVITAVDEEGKIRQATDEIRPLLTEGLITLHEVEVIRPGSGERYS